MRALLSVYDKAGLVPFAQGLADLGVELVASGKTYAALGEAGIAALEVAEVTGAPEMLGGRVKTLHPKIHGAILADRSVPTHLEEVERYEITPIDLVVCNLYPFRTDPSIELIDVGGPTMVRAAAKNHAHVAIVVDPADYDVVLAELREHGRVLEATRVRLARAAFAHTAAYDAAIVSWFDGTPARPAALDESITLTFERAASLRYGENPHQHGARYRRAGYTSFWDGVTQHAGTELSYLNLFDADAAWRLVHELSEDADGTGAVAIIKHANACGSAVDADLVTAYAKALACDETSAFGGVVAVRGSVDAALAEVMAAGPQADVVIASSYSPEAVATLVGRRKATRLLEAPAPEAVDLTIRSLGSGALIQEPDAVTMDRSNWRVVTERAPSDEEWRDLAVAWRVCARTSSNAVVVVNDTQAIGIGAGQQSRVVAAELAVTKAGERAKGAAGASDAFFPFPDGLEVLIEAGVSAVIQPGGSIRDNDVIEVANRAGITMVLTGERHFRH